MFLVQHIQGRNRGRWVRKDYRAWLEAQKYGAGTITAQMHRAGRVEDYYGDLDQHHRADRLASVINALRYTTEDERRGRPNPSKIPFEGNPRTNLASYRNAVENYRRFLAEVEDSGDGTALETPASSPPCPSAPDEFEEAGQRIGLERDMQAALRVAIEQLEPGLTIIDDGTERYVESGRIDITARDAHAAIVVIELKAGIAGQRAVAQILSYMGDVALEEPQAQIRGILVASDFDKKAIAAARMAPSLSLKKYAVQFRFADAG